MGLNFPTMDLYHPSDLQNLITTLENSDLVSYILDSDLRFAYCNPAWDEFASENGAPQLNHLRVVGTQLMPSIPLVLTPFYLRVFEEVRNSGLIWQYVYECSSPDRFRKFRMRVHQVNGDWWLVSNALVVEEGHHATAAASDAIYRGSNGLINMCSHCRCTQRTDKPTQWDFVPQYLVRTSQALTVSHGICPICYAYFYPPNGQPLREQPQ